MNISYLTNYDAQDIHQWSGLGYYIAKAVENQGADLSYISNLYTNKINIHLAKKLFYLGIGKRHLTDRSPRIAKIIALRAQKQINNNTDLVFSPGSQALAFLKSDKPKAFYTDACFAGMVDFYKSFKNLSSETIHNGNLIEKAAINNSNLAIYASDWAAEAAIKNYNVNPDKIKVVPFGANTDSKHTYDSIKSIIDKKSTSHCHLLFVGVEWERKGGPTVLEVARILNEKGLKTTLHIVGLPNIPVNPIPDFVKNYGFISKRTTVGKTQIDDLFNKSHFLIVPSIAEAYGLVFCEANSFGLPAIATNVGGIPTIIKNDINGQLFSIVQQPADYATYIYNIFSSNNYKELCYSSFDRYETLLNWNVAGKTLISLFKEVI